MESPSLGVLGSTFLRLGLQSFGGGTATLALIQREVVDRREWFSEAEFTRDWSLCQVAPGINLICLTLLLGWRLRGFGGAVAATAGLLVPSAAATVALTAAYASYQNSPTVAAALKGVVPATIGLGLLTAVQTARPILRTSRTEGGGSFALSLGLIGLAAILGEAQVPVALILVGAGAVGALVHWRLRLRAAGDPADEGVSV